MATVHILMPLNTKAKHWLDSHVKPGIMSFGQGIVILESEIKYLDHLLYALDSAGFVKASKNNISKKKIKADYLLNVLK
jgi:hypothetical protein